MRKRKIEENQHFVISSRCKWETNRLALRFASINRWEFRQRPTNKIGENSTFLDKIYSGSNFPRSMSIRTFSSSITMRLFDSNISKIYRIYSKFDRKQKFLWCFLNIPNLFPSVIDYSQSTRRRSNFVATSISTKTEFVAQSDRLDRWFGSVKRMKNQSWRFPLSFASACRTLEHLTMLNISHNNVSTLSPLNHCRSLESLDASFNLIRNIDDLSQLTSLKVKRALHTLFYFLSHRQEVTRWNLFSSSTLIYRRIILPRFFL